MALSAYMKLVGQKRGEIKGTVTQKGREGSTRVIAFNHEVTVPTDTSTGLPTGKHIHKPIVIVKEVDRTSPLLMGMFLDNENIKTLELRFWRPQASIGTGSEVQYLTIQLENAAIINIRQEMLNIQSPEYAKYPEQEYVSFRYGKIIWTAEETKQTYESTVDLALGS